MRESKKVGKSFITEQPRKINQNLEFERRTVVTACFPDINRFPPRVLNILSHMFQRAFFEPRHLRLAYAYLLGDLHLRSAAEKT